VPNTSPPLTRPAPPLLHDPPPTSSTDPLCADPPRESSPTHTRRCELPRKSLPFPTLDRVECGPPAFASRLRVPEASFDPIQVSGLCLRSEHLPTHTHSVPWGADRAGSRAPCRVSIIDALFCGERVFKTPWSPLYVRATFPGSCVHNGPVRRIHRPPWSPWSAPTTIPFSPRSGTGSAAAPFRDCA